MDREVTEKMADGGRESLQVRQGRVDISRQRLSPIFVLI